MHVSLRDLCSSNEDARAELRELRGLLAGTQQDRGLLVKSLALGFRAIISGVYRVPVKGLY